MPVFFGNMVPGIFVGYKWGPGGLWHQEYKVLYTPDLQDFTNRAPGRRIHVWTVRRVEQHMPLISPLFEASQRARHQVPVGDGVHVHDHAPLDAEITLCDQATSGAPALELADVVPRAVPHVARGSPDDPPASTPVDFHPVAPVTELESP